MAKKQNHINMATAIPQRTSCILNLPILTFEQGNAADQKLWPVRTRNKEMCNRLARSEKIAYFQTPVNPVFVAQAATRSISALDALQKRYPIDEPSILKDSGSSLRHRVQCLIKGSISYCFFLLLRIQ